MAALLQTVVAEFIDGIVRAYGPFVIPVTLFAVGAVGYVVLVALDRAGLGEGFTEPVASDRTGTGPSDAAREDTDAGSEENT